MDLFNQATLKHYRNKSALNYSNFNFLKKEIASVLLEHLETIKNNFDLVLDINSALGETSNILKTSSKLGNVIATDISPTMLNLNKECNTKINMSAEALTFKENIFDLIVANCSLHNSNNFQQIIKNIFKILKPNGLFMAAIFCDDNLSNLKEVLAEADFKYNNSVSPRVYPFLDFKQVGDMLQGEGFESIVLQKEKLTIMYRSIINIFKDLRGMGEHNVLYNKNPNIVSLKYLHILKEVFKQKIDKENNAYPMNIEVAIVLAWKPLK